MESLEILNEYLVSRSDLEDILSFDKFIRLFPSSTPEDLIRKIFDELIFQKNEDILKVHENIKKSFDIPLEDIAKEFNVPSNRFSLNSIVDLLGQMSSTSRSSVKLLDDIIKNIYEETDSLIDQINVGSFEHITTNLQGETEEEVDRCMSLIVR